MCDSWEIHVEFYVRSCQIQLSTRPRQIATLRWSFWVVLLKSLSDVPFLEWPLKSSSQRGKDCTDERLSMGYHAWAGTLRVFLKLAVALIIICAGLYSYVVVSKAQFSQNEFLDDFDFLCDGFEKGAATEFQVFIAMINDIYCSCVFMFLTTYTLILCRCIHYYELGQSYLFFVRFYIIMSLTTFIATAMNNDSSPTALCLLSFQKKWIFCARNTNPWFIKTHVFYQNETACTDIVITTLVVLYSISLPLKCLDNCTTGSFIFDKLVVEMLG